jgi:hypothetical protein
MAGALPLGFLLRLGALALRKSTTCWASAFRGLLVEGERIGRQRDIRIGDELGDIVVSSG